MLCASLHKVVFWIHIFLTYQKKKFPFGWIDNISAVLLVCNKLFEGKCRYITSDCDAVAVIYEEHKYAKAPEDAVADVIKAGKVVVAWVE